VPKLKLDIYCIFFSNDASRFGRLIADWSVKNMSPDVTPMLDIPNFLGKQKEIQY
jgi:hypothetical protein